MRRRVIALVLLGLWVGSLHCGAQTVVAGLDEALSSYDFSRAETLLNTEINKLRRKRQPTDELEERLEYVHKAMSMMGSVERVVVFDSVALPKDKVLDALCLSGESGRVMMTSDFKGLNGGEGTLFRSEMGDKVYYSAPAAFGVQRLFMADLFNDELGQPEAVQGLTSEADTPCNYPYMMPDGLTLYFASQGDGSLGGYDIFMTRYDPDDHRFLSPENVGMPFNSPANDYLLCIDEAYNLGCFVTDRGMSADSVCVYYFIPNAMRSVYYEDEVGDEALRTLARLGDIRMTWGEETEVKAALARLSQLRAETESTVKVDFTFVVSDNRTCHTLDDFRNTKARLLVEKWQQDLAVLAEWKASLEGLRQVYANSTSAQKAAMKSQILKLEAETEALSDDIRAEEKAIRKAELGM